MENSTEMLKGNYNCFLPFFFLSIFFLLSCHSFFLLGVQDFSEAIVTVNDFSLLAIITFVPGDCSRLSGLWQALTAISSFLLCTNFLRGAQKKILFLHFPSPSRASPSPLLCPCSAPRRICGENLTAKHMGGTGTSPGEEMSSGREHSGSCYPCCVCIHC